LKKIILVRLSFILIIALSVGFSCQQKKSAQGNSTHIQGNDSASIQRLSFKSPQNGQVIKIGQSLSFKVAYKDSSKSPDSIQFQMDAIRIGAIKRTSEALDWVAPYTKTGSHVVSAVAYFSSNPQEQENIQIELYPEKPPILYTYKIIRTYPHDKEAYTQGLLYDHGQMIESTGLKGKSSLRRVKFETGEILKFYRLPDDIFGEGIASFNGKILQISWQDQVAFLYDKASFTLINKFNYPFKEGWGLTYDGTNLIMSDGSSNLYFLDKEYFSELNSIQVCDDKGPVDKLNELEYIDGEVWANIYYTDWIVRIDPKTGVVLGKIDMSGLLKPEDRNSETNVLNGIAYDPQTKRIWVTGKNWPKLFQIAVLQKGR
jgi:glutamine cyclotransferase